MDHVFDAPGGSERGRRKATSRPPGRDAHLPRESPFTAQRIQAARDYLQSPADRGAEADSSARRSWEEFYTICDPFIRRVVQTWRIPRSDVDDCVQEVWVEVAGPTGLSGYNPRRGSFEAWLFTLIRRKVGRHLRGTSRQPVVGLFDPAARRDRGSDPVDAYQRREDRELVRHALEVLRTRVSEKNYRVVRLRWIEGRETPEIADDVDLTQDQVRYRLQRMKRKLQSLLGPRVKAPSSRGRRKTGS